MKLVTEIDSEGFAVGTVEADESPLEPGVYLVPAGCVDARVGEIPEGKRAKWNPKTKRFRFVALPKPKKLKPKEEAVSWEHILWVRSQLLHHSAWAEDPEAKHLLGKKRLNQLLAYRQALREIPRNFQTPAEVKWPDKPTK